MSRFLSIPVVTLFLISILVTSLHIHSDRDDHSSCSLCAFLQNLSTLENAGHFESIPSQAEAVTMHILESYDAYNQFLYIPKQSRSPPV
jgi:hypothetical protein